MKIIIGAKYNNEIEELKNTGAEIITFNGNPKLEDEIRYHADIHIFSCNNGSLIIEGNVAGEIEPYLDSYNIIKSESIFSPYPNDIKLNCALIGNYMLCNKKYISPVIRNFCTTENIEIIHTNQGYAKCSVCILNDYAVITDCHSIACLLNNYQLDVLKIKPGYITLSDRHYGFIGGASGKLNDHQIYFSGDLSKHPDFAEINKFLNKYNIEPVFNKNRPLNDFGGFIKLF